MKELRFPYKPRYENSYALVVGINDYANINPLSYAVSDAKAIASLLKDELGFPSSNITCLLDHCATKKSILDSLLSYAGSHINADDRVIIFFAGHGHTITGIRGEVGYLVPYDADLSNLNTLIRWSDLTNNSELIPAKHILFIMDACYGGLALTRSLHSGSTRFLNDMMRRMSRQVLTAGKANEVVSDSGGPIPEHSVFTGHLIQGIQGNAVDSFGVLTANSLMAYVYRMVANDKNSNQSPHFGHLDGDGDFILKSPLIVIDDATGQTGQDRLLPIAWTESDVRNSTIEDRIGAIKDLLSTESASIKLHDFMVSEVRSFLELSASNSFNPGEQFSIEEMLKRLAVYEDISIDFAILFSCIAYWAQDGHRRLIRKITSRMTDRISIEGGRVVWLNLRWYPLIICLYSVGIACIENSRYDTLYDLLFSETQVISHRHKNGNFLIDVSEGILELTRSDVFKKIPDHERNYTPMSEYLYKLLQPKLDDAFFIGKEYEKSFDNFEVFFALAVADANQQLSENPWGPIGRFGWKQHREDTPLIAQMLQQAKNSGPNWAPLKAGFFGGSLDRFEAVATKFSERIAGLNWW